MLRVYDLRVGQPMQLVYTRDYEGRTHLAIVACGGCCRCHTCHPFRAMLEVEEDA